MKTYIWKDLDKITSRYHDDGGLVIITDGNPLMQWLAYRQQQEDNTFIRTELPNPYLIMDCVASEKDMTLESQVIVFPNTGCC